MALQTCYVHLAGPAGLVDSMRFMVTSLGGHVVPAWQEQQATHVVCMQPRPHRDTEVAHVHPLWVARCYNTKSRADERRYDLRYLRLVEACGTSPLLGSVDQYDRELPQFHAVEVLLYTYDKRVSLGKALQGACADFDLRDSEVWPYAWHMLHKTVFWGDGVRALNWRARRTLMLCLARAHARGHGPQDVGMPASLLLALGPDLARAVILYL